MPSDLPNLPNTITDPAVKEFLQKYYAVSNDKDAHDDYADLFTSDGEFSINDKKSKGTKGNFSPQPIPQHLSLITLPQRLSPLLQLPITKTNFPQKSAIFAKRSGPTSPAAITAPFRSTRTATTRWT